LNKKLKIENMQLHQLTHNNTGEKVFDIEKTSSKMDLSKVFSQKSNSYLNEFTLYIAHFNYIPNAINERSINCKKANCWFAETYQSEIKKTYYNKLHFNRSKQAELDDIFYFLYEDLMVDFDTNNSMIRFLFHETELSKVEEIINAVRKFKKRKNREKPEISLLINGLKGVETKTFQITKPKLNINDNYNEDFREIHNTILKRLSVRNDKGLVLLHGKPGTGKTSYIRYLTSSLKKKVIFLPPNMASAITNPNFYFHSY
jgi:Cdc6-like AAA superfamily ATPase